MDALSALKFVIGPEAASKLTGGIKGGGAADVAPKAIPLEDLQKLTLGNTPSAASSVGASGAAGSAGAFQNLLSNFVGEVNTQQLAAGDALTGLMSGKNVSLHQAMISMQEASVSFQMMVEVRNKLLESYQELMRMQV